MTATATAQAETGETSRHNFESAYDLVESMAKIGYWRWRSGDDRPLWSPGLNKIFGYDPNLPAPYIGWVREHIHPDDRAVFDHSRELALTTPEPFHVQVRMNEPEPCRILEIHRGAEFDETGKPTLLVSFFQDVTERVRADADREQAKALYQIITEQAHDIISLQTPDGKFLFVSPALKRVQGFEPGELTREQILDLVHEDDKDELRKSFPAPKPGESTTAVYRTRHKDGHWLWFETVRRGVYDASGQLRHTVGVTRDITARKVAELELKAAQERADAANKAKSRFLANMSHELRTPLNAVIGFADVMRNELLGPLGTEKYKEYVNLIHNSGQMLLDLISDILDMAKIEAGKMQLHYETVDLPALIDDCLKIIGPRAQQGRVKLESDVLSELVLEADQRAVRQVLLNLLSNAVKFSSGGTVTVTARQEGDDVVIAVRDTGIGIPASAMPRLGQPFEQVCADPMLAQGGTGLGLALVRSLAGMHGGTMDIHSDEGTGTIVTMRFPRTAQSREAA